MFTEERRVSETRNRQAVITPNFALHPADKAYDITLTEKGRVITRTFKQRVTTLKNARHVARVWCR